MNFQFYVEKLNSFDEYKKFINENKKAFPCSCFFIVDFQGEDNKQHFDYFVPEDKKFFSFQLENSKLVPVEASSDKIPEKISLDLEFDFKEVEDLISKRMEKEGIKNKIQKFLFSLQRKDGKHFLIGTVFISMLGLLKVTVDLEKMEIVDFEKKSFFDVMKVKRGK